MIRRLKRQTKRRHSVRRERFVTFRQTIRWEAISGPIITARYSPDVWAP
jgi:hypothetical protein